MYKPQETRIPKDSEINPSPSVVMQVPLSSALTRLNLETIKLIPLTIVQHWLVLYTWTFDAGATFEVILGLEATGFSVSLVYCQWLEMTAENSRPPESFLWVWPPPPALYLFEVCFNIHPIPLSVTHKSHIKAVICFPFVFRDQCQLLSL